MEALADGESSDSGRCFMVRLGEIVMTNLQACGVV